MRIGLLGASKIAPLALIGPGHRRDDVELVAVAARDRGRAEAYAAEHGIGRVVADYEALVTAPDVDLVYVGLPPVGHRPWSIAALEAGKHVLCEKPFALNEDEAREMVAVSERTGGRLVEAFHWRYHPLADRVAGLVGRLGPLRRIEARFVVGDVAVGDLRRLLDQGGGALMDLGCYAVHWARVYGGAEPEVVTAEAVEDPTAPGVDMELRGELRFPGGAVGLVEAAMGRPGFEALLVVEGEEGRVEVVNPIHPSSGYALRYEGPGGPLDETVPAGGLATFDHQLAAVLGAIAGGGPLPTEGGDPIANMAVIDALYRAAGMAPRGLAGPAT
jgi:predicted dehydrogenase